MLVDKQLPSLVGGVSQQPATVRLPSQAEDVTNTWLSVVDGAQTRNPTEHVALLSADDLSDSHVHFINRDITERYVVILDGNTVRVFDIDGNEKTVTSNDVEDLTEFFATDAAGEGIATGETFFLTGAYDTGDGDFATAKGDTREHGDAFKRTGASSVEFVADYAGMLAGINATAITVSGADLSAFFAGAGSGVSAGDVFKVASTADTSDTAFATAKGSAPAANDLFKRTGATSIIFVGALADIQVAEATMVQVSSFAYLYTEVPREDYVCVTVADYTFILNRRMIVRLAPEDGQPGSSTTAQPARRYTMIPRYDGATADDPRPMGSGGGGFRGQRARQLQYSANPSGGTLQGTVQTFQDLPSGASSGDIYKVQGHADTGFATYYVRSEGGNVWNETVAPGLRNRIDASTMPHALVRKADGTFEFAEFSWADRRVGDETTNPNPTFVGREIRDIFWYKNRFGVAVDEGVVLTRVGDFGNFYRNTVVDVLDDDRIDVQASETKVTKINYAVPFDGSIMLFSDQTQLRLSHGSEGLTPGNATLDPVTNFRMVSNVRPFSIGADVYFAADNGEWAAIREYFVAPDTQVNDAANVTGHVPKYIPKENIRRLSGSDTHNVLMVLSGTEAGELSPGGASNEIFVYQFHWVNESEKAQSAWNKWVMSTDCGVVSADVVDSTIYMVIVRPDGTHLETLSLEPDRTIVGGFMLCMDRLSIATVGSYNAGTNRTSFELPYDVASAARANFRLLSTSGLLLEASAGSYVWTDANTVTLPGNLLGHAEAFCGVMYEYRIEFSEQFARNAQDVPMLNGKLMLRNWTVHFEDTAYFEIEVAPYGEANPTAEPIIPALTAAGQKQTETLAYFETEEPEFLNGIHQFGVYGASDEAVVAITATSPYRVKLTQAEWEGFYHKRSRTI